jgi:hypothetical protein
MRVLERLLGNNGEEYSYNEVCDIPGKLYINNGDHIFNNEKRYKVIRKEYNAESGEMNIIVIEEKSDFYPKIKKVEECPFCYSKKCSCT